MFERLAAGARAAVVAAQEEARALAHDAVGTEHLVLGALADEPTARVLRAHGMTAEVVRAEVDALRARGDPTLDADALAVLGIDLDAVRRRVEQSFGPGALGPRRRRCRRGARTGALPLTPEAKRALELALREAVAGGAGSIGSGHMLLGVLRAGDGRGARVLAAHGVGPDALRERGARGERG